ncbi:signal transduction histidine kinase [Rhodovulum imhoffii]|uniref:histidine kinase n=1 Tax=Rhodovulum imhoffii TaxID=365340 RepID=A0A2T5BTY1_9RHOB|nr:signal transduction histidine kinase [Rhodovulum imhoffii]
MTQRRRKVRSGIAVTLAAYGLMIAAALGLVTGCIQIVQDYRTQTKRDETFIQSILQISSSGAAEAAFQLDSDLAAEAIKSLMIYDFMFQVRISDERGAVLAEVRRAFEPSLLDRLTPLFSKPFRNYSIDLTNQSTRLNVGTLEVMVNQNTLLSDFYSRSVRSMLSGLLKNLILTLILLNLFYVTLSRPLSWLAEKLNRVDPRQPEPFDLPGSIGKAENEVTMVALSANSILAASRKHLQELEEANSKALKLDEKLRQSERLSVVGQLVGGVAHDYNNILAIILGNLELVRPERLTQAERKALERARSTVIRGADLAAQLLVFSRKQPLAPSIILAGDFLQELHKFSRPVLGEQHEFNFAADPDVWPCLADKRQLEAALLNLTINASHATPKGGKILIECFNARLDAEYCATEDTLEPGDYVCFRVSDTGEGMSETVMSHAFEPYFTTKPEGEGSGLGLSMVYGFAKQSGGHVKIHSQENVGTRVELYLPRSEQEADGQIPGMAHPHIAAGRENLSGKRILVVEDHPDVLEVVKDHLETMQATVITFTSGQDAIAYAQNNTPVDIAILDVILTDSMNGPDVKEVLSQLWPGLKTVFMSGYSEGILGETGRFDQNTILLQKPFSRQRLVEVLTQLNEVCDGP